MTIEQIIESEGWRKFMLNLEKLSSLVLLAGLVLFVVKDNPNILLILGFTTLALIYFFEGFKELKSNTTLSNSFFKIYGWGLAISSVSMMFTLMKWPINSYSIVISMVIVLVSILLGFKLRNDNNKNVIDKFYFIRLAIALLLLGFVYFSKEIL
jgi:uncharacterized membrane protein YjjP (DUF1212 family)